MALVARSTGVSHDSSNPFLASINGLSAGEAVVEGDVLYLKSDGLLWLADGTAATAPAVARGFAAGPASANEPVTALCYGWRFLYDTAAGLTPGALLYLMSTPGRLSTVATTGGTTPIAYAVSTTDIVSLII